MSLHSTRVIISLSSRFGFKTVEQNGENESDTARRQLNIAFDILLHSIPPHYLNPKPTLCHRNGLSSHTTLLCSALTIATILRSRTFHQGICSCIILLRITLLRTINPTQSLLLLLAAARLQARHIQMAPFQCILYNTRAIQMATTINEFLLRSNILTQNKLHSTFDICPTRAAAN